MNEILKGVFRVSCINSPTPWNRTHSQLIANSNLVNLKISLHLWNYKIHHCLHSRGPPATILFQITPVNSFPSLFLCDAFHLRLSFRNYFSISSNSLLKLFIHLFLFFLCATRTPHFICLTLGRSLIKTIFLVATVEFSFSCRKFQNVTNNQSYSGHSRLTC